MRTASTAVCLDLGGGVRQCPLGSVVGDGDCYSPRTLAAVHQCTAARGR